jgi:hypothetical protein
MIRYTLIGFGLCGLLAIAPPSYAKKAAFARTRRV